MKHFWQGFQKRAAAMKEVATVAIFNGNTGQMLMGKRRDNKSWTNPGGHLDSGEKPLDGAQREVLEETGINILPDDLDRMSSRVVTKQDGKKIKIHTFKAFLNNKEKTSLRYDPDQEVSSWRWVETTGGLPEYIKNNLHVPLEENALLQDMGLAKAAAKNLPYEDFYTPIGREAVQRAALMQGLITPQEAKNRGWSDEIIQETGRYRSSTKGPDSYDNLKEINQKN